MAKVGRIPNAKAYSMLLRKLGFKKQSESTAGGERLVVYTKELNAIRKLELQLWGSGYHRVSHYINGRMTTKPTPFTTTSLMCFAIGYESARWDNLNYTEGKVAK